MIHRDTSVEDVLKVGATTYRGVAEQVGDDPNRRAEAGREHRKAPQVARLGRFAGRRQRAAAVKLDPAREDDPRQHGEERDVDGVNQPLPRLTMPNEQHQQHRARA